MSSEELAAASGVTSAKLRKDLSHLGSYGTRGVGYDIEYLVYQIARELGLTQDWPVVIVGVGNLGHALANYGGFASRGFRVVGPLDADPRRVGEKIPAGRGGEPVEVRPLADLEDVVPTARPASASSPRRRPPPRRSATASSPPASRASSTSRRSCSRRPTASTSARSTSRPSCRSSPSTSSASVARPEVRA